MADQRQYIQEILDATMAELDERLDTPLTEKNRIAVTSAIGKAAFRAFLRGSAETQGQINADWLSMRDRFEALLPPGTSLPDQFTQVDVTVLEPDLWAERYGGED